VGEKKTDPRGLRGSVGSRKVPGSSSSYMRRDSVAAVSASSSSSS
jgi:hypothetical protein